jgi:hypothetical protein
MSQAQLAAGPDRLPWLADEPPPRAKRDAKPNPALAAGVLVALAAASFWIATHNWLQQSPAPEPPATTVKLPEARTTQMAPQQQQHEVKVAPQAQVTPTPLPVVRQERAREVRIEPPRTVKVAKSIAPTEAVVPEAEPVAAAGPPPALVRPAPLKPWPAWRSAGAKGRIVRIGAFGTRERAKLGWWAMVRAYPAVAHLKATVVGDRNSRGRHFYRFQIGTTSQAHSEVLCQRMEKIGFSCAVIGLPWKSKVER